MLLFKTNLYCCKLKNTISSLIKIQKFWKRRREEKKAGWDKQPVCSSSSYTSSALAIDSLCASVVEALFTLEASMDDIQRRLRIVVSDTTSPG
ncbi:uncharacterized protein MONOS_15251 [Monocercomonoides exilis]|uniref:uncharacterized protein n=1 Tax=Monocercomonoides exilis TaxID=2049356 RepID=UPI00355AAAAA|nr:hypothetical protein MONOS_15251 [Monocercomonoides exilis]|eukprot:MONOS_15251.1-p1 / transcript=MONOS_15251.1 / gene=MONOS_15251 / organism=Monocercomonoides_exilis_PA203 / gene_product=unspecified product / transcript_product=unspecified product / location=Mono_scaffold01179:639-978(+) / protein_length=93 / sequence_SO=supercontig / SO=protein_coding / is_pseudo=false